MTSKKRIKTKTLPVPASRQEAEKLLAEIGEHQRAADLIHAKASDHAARIELKASEDAKEHNEAIDGKFQALYAWAETNRKELLKGDSKTVKLATGVLAWRNTPPAVQIGRGKEQEVLEQLTGKRLHHCIRVTSAVNKEAILAEVAADPEFLEHIAGIKVTSREEFVAKPSEVTQEYVETVTTSKGKK